MLRGEERRAEGFEKGRGGGGEGMVESTVVYAVVDWCGDVWQKARLARKARGCV